MKYVLRVFQTAGCFPTDQGDLATEPGRNGIKADCACQWMNLLDGAGARGMWTDQVNRFLVGYLEEVAGNFVDEAVEGVGFLQEADGGTAVQAVVGFGFAVAGRHEDANVGVDLL